MLISPSNHCEDLSTTMTQHINKLLTMWNVKYYNNKGGKDDNNNNNNNNNMAKNSSSILEYSNHFSPLYTFNEKVKFSSLRLTEFLRIMDDEQTLVSLVTAWRRKEFFCVTCNEMIIMIKITFEESENRGKAIRIIEANPNKIQKGEGEGEEEGEGKEKEEEEKTKGNEERETENEKSNETKSIKPEEK